MGRGRGSGERVERVSGKGGGEEGEWGGGEWEGVSGRGEGGSGRMRGGEEGRGWVEGVAGGRKTRHVQRVLSMKT